MTVPYKYQIFGARQLSKFDGCGLLADEPGLGKSFQSLMYAYRHPQVRPIIIICPATLKLNWERECKIHFNFRSAILWGTKAFQLDPKCPIYILNYEILWPWMECLTAINPQLVIADESHRIKTWTAKCTKAVRQLCKNVPHRICISGTPLTNRPAELYPSLHICRPDLYDNRIAFYRRYCGIQYTPWGIKYDGAVRLPELHKRLTNDLMIRRLKKDVLQDLPLKRRFTVPLPLSDQEQYELASDNFVSWIYKHKPGKLGAVQRAERLAQMSYLRQLAGQLKFKSVCEWVDNFLAESDEKIILFAWHTELIWNLHEKYKKLSVVVDGSVTNKKRQKAIDQFLHNKKTRIFIGNIKAAGLGWSAKGVSTVAFVEYSFVPGDHTQAEDRVHGIGRGSEGVRSTVYYLCAPSTIEQPLLEIIQKKQKVLSHVLDGKGRGEDLPVHDLLHEALLKRKRKI